MQDIKGVYLQRGMFIIFSCISRTEDTLETRIGCIVGFENDCVVMKQVRKTNSEWKRIKNDIHVGNMRAIFAVSPSNIPDEVRMLFE